MKNQQKIVVSLFFSIIAKKSYKVASVIEPPSI